MRLTLHKIINGQRCGRRWRWSQEEIDLLVAGKPVPGRSYWGCLQKRHELGIYKRGPNRCSQPYKAPVAVPGEIPPPDWWRRAWLMREQGYKPGEIGAALGRDPILVAYALYPEAREKQRVRQQRYEAKRVLMPGYRQKRAAWDSVRDTKRKMLRVVAREQWRARGGKPSDLKKVYREYGCL